MQLIFVHPVVIFLENTHLKYVYPSNAMAHTKGPIFSEKDWYYLQAQTAMPFHYKSFVSCRICGKNAQKFQRRV